MWAQMRTAVDEAIRKRITDFSGWKLSGDTILAAQWHHRKSTDVDLKVGAKTGLAILDPRYDPSFDQEMKELGEGQPIHRQDQIIIPVGESKIDIFEGHNNTKRWRRTDRGKRRTGNRTVERADPDRETRRARPRESHTRPIRRGGGRRAGPSGT